MSGDVRAEPGFAEGVGGVWRVHDMAEDAGVRVVRRMQDLPAALDREVGRLWDAAQARLDGRLFNGRVFSVDVLTPHLLCGHWTEFRRIVAQMDRPELHPELAVRPLAVGGLIICPDGIVFGRRPARAVYQAGAWQLAPAGSVDGGSAGAEGRVDWRAQLREELLEELGMPAEAVAIERVICLVEHAGSHVLDLGVVMRSAWGATRIRAAHAALGNDEYASLDVVALSELAEFGSAGRGVADASGAGVSAPQRCARQGW